MPFAARYRLYTFTILLLVAVLAAGALLAAQWPFMTSHGISPLILAVAIGLFVGHQWRQHLPVECTPGLTFAAKTLLRLAIVLYGFRITVQDIASVGAAGLLVSCSVVVLTLVVGTYVGQKWFGLDRDSALLSAAGSAVCGAAAVVATESVLRSDPHKAAIAIATVVCFGSVAMVLYPLLSHFEILQLSERAWGVFIGGTVHEVAQVVAIGNTFERSIADTAVIVKMTRVLLLVPALFVIVWLGRGSKSADGKRHGRPPWFALGFLAVVGLHSLHILPAQWVAATVELDTALLTMAMVALGMDINFAKIRAAGWPPLAHGLFLFIWLMISGYMLTQWAIGAVG